MSELLSVADVARLRGCDQSTAWRLLVTLEREHGAKLVRDKRAIRISHDELQQSLARMPPQNSRRAAREIATMRRRIGSCEARVNALESQVREFRRMAHEWLTKKA